MFSQLSFTDSLHDSLKNFACILITAMVISILKHALLTSICCQDIHAVAIVTNGYYALLALCVGMDSIVVDMLMLQED